MRTAAFALGAALIIVALTTVLGPLGPVVALGLALLLYSRGR